MPDPRHDKEKRLELERRVWELRQAGWTQARIGREIGAPQGSVCRMLARVYRRALSRLNDAVAAERLHQVETLDHIVDEALQAWERSKKPKKRSAKRTGGSGKGGEQLSQEATERDGDPVFLATAMSALDRQAKLLDLAVKPTEESSRGVDVRSALIEAEAADAAFPSDDQPAPVGNP